MKVVKSADALKRLALARGSSASLGGVRFNSASDTVLADRPAKPEPEPIAVEAKTLPDNNDLLTKIVELLARPAPEIRMPDIVMPEIKIPEIKMPDLQWPAAPPAQPAQQVSWVFKVERDVRGLMTQIVATSR